MIDQDRQQTEIKYLIFMTFLLKTELEKGFGQSIVYIIIDLLHLIVKTCYDKINSFNFQWIVLRLV